MTRYEPLMASRSRLGAIVSTLEQATPIAKHFETLVKAIRLLPTGQLYYDSVLNLDTDGSQYYTQDATGQIDTSLRQADGGPIDANAVPYFVLPETGFYQEFGIQLGDIAAVLCGANLEFAVFADEGQNIQLLGEGSIALHRSLGHETIVGGQLIDDAIDSDVITIVFPGSGRGPGLPPPSVEEVRRIGRRLFTALGGVLP